MLGCGGIVDLSEHLSLSANLSVYVFDSSRPYNLRNIFSNAQVRLRAGEDELDMVAAA